MINLAIVGSTGLDNIKTPFGEVFEVLGGSAIYGALAASFFAKPGLISICGKDLNQEQLDSVRQYGVDLGGLQRGKKTFRWSGLYEYDMNEAKTLETQLNSLADFQPSLPTKYKNAAYIFLANLDPAHQLEIINQAPKDAFILLDTMNYWIISKKNLLLKAIKKATAVVLNEEEARQLFKTANLIQAGRMLINLGPEYAIIKKAEHGALLFTYQDFFSAPGYPLEEVKDPTGCGDSFGGAFIGYLAKKKDLTKKNIRQAIIYGSSVASFCAEYFGTDYVKNINLGTGRRFTTFEDLIFCPPI